MIAMSRVLENPAALGEQNDTNQFVLAHNISIYWHIILFLHNPMAVGGFRRAGFLSLAKDIH